MTRHSSLKSFLALLLSFCLLLFITEKDVFAASSRFTVSPSIMTFSTDGTKDVEHSFSVQNTGSTPLTLTLSIRPFTSGKNGDIVYGNEQTTTEVQKNFITKNVSVLENGVPISSLTLSPGQSQSLLLHITINKDQNISESTFSLIFLTDPSNEKSQEDTDEITPLTARLSIRLGSAMHILIAPKNVKSNFRIQSLSTPSFIQHAPVAFAMSVENQGEKHINIYGNITITNAFGQRVGLIRIPNTILLSHTTKQLGTNSTLEPLSWQGGFLLGPYTAHAILIDEDGIEQSADIRFFAFPLRTTILVLLGILIANFLISEVRKRV